MFKYVYWFLPPHHIDRARSKRQRKERGSNSSISFSEEKEAENCAAICTLKALFFALGQICPLVLGTSLWHQGRSMGQIQWFLALSSGYWALTSLYPLITNFRSTIAYFRLSILTSFKLGCRPFVIYSGHYFCCPGQLSTYVVLNCLLQHNIVQMDL